MDIDEVRLYLGRTGELIPATEAETWVPEAHGLYSIHIDDARNLPSPFSDYMISRKHDMLYLGKAARSFFSKRLVKNDLRHKGHGSFFRSLGAVIGYTPEPGSLVNKKNRTNYRFSQSARQSIVEWIDEHLAVRCLGLGSDEIAFEPNLIDFFRPVLNDVHNPDVLPELRKLRKRCRSVALRE